MLIIWKNFGDAWAWLATPIWSSHQVIASDVNQHKQSVHNTICSWLIADSSFWNIFWARTGCLITMKKLIWNQFFTSMDTSIRFQDILIWEIMQFDWSKSFLGLNRLFRVCPLLINLRRSFPLLMSRYMPKINLIPQYTFKILCIVEFCKLFAWEHFGA